MPSNLPPGVTDRMVDAQFSHEDVEAIDAFEWYLDTDEFLEHLSVWVFEATQEILSSNAKRPQWLTTLLVEYLNDNEDHVVNRYVESLEDV